MPPIEPPWLPAELATDLSILFRLVVAMVLGTLIGWEREAAGKAAGVRTHVLVALGAALFVALGDAMIERFASLPSQGAEIRADPLRIIEAVVTGISFLGAGTIFVSRGRERVEGLTTAAAIWTTAAIGIAGGLERYALGAGAALLVLVILRLMPLLPIEGGLLAALDRRRRRTCYGAATAARRRRRPRPTSDRQSGPLAGPAQAGTTSVASPRAWASAVSNTTGRSHRGSKPSRLRILRVSDHWTHRTGAWNVTYAAPVFSAR